MTNTNIYDGVDEQPVIDVPVIAEESRPLTLEEKVDIIGQQLNWLCENLSQLFGLVNTLSTSGGGIRGLMKAMNAMKENGTDG